MVGRDGDLLALRDAWKQAQAAGPRWVVTRGEAGIGKSRLVTEFLDMLGGETAVAVGQCLDTTGSVGVPYASVKGIIRDLEAAFGAEALLAAAGPHAKVLTALVPRLAPPDGSTGDDPGEATGEQLHEAVTDLLGALSELRPIVMVLEDLHWADLATLALLRALLRMLRRSRVLVLLTFRPEDVGRGHPLRALSVQLDRNTAVDRVELVPLDAETVGEQARLITGRPLGREEVAQIVRRSEGVPFFVEEFLGMAGPGTGLPSTLRELVMARYERLTTGTQRMLRCLATGGATVEHSLLEQVLADPAGALDGAAAEAIDAGVIVAGAFDYSFRHALLREGILGVLLPGERSQWHSQYAEALAQRSDAESYRVQIADHWLAARNLPEAFGATMTAMASSSSLAPVTAAMLGEQAIELWSQVPDAEAVAGLRLDELLYQVAQEHQAADNVERVSLLLGLALEAVPADEHLARATYLHAKALADHIRGADPDPMLREVLDILSEAPQTTGTQLEQAQVMASLAITSGCKGQPGRARDLALEAADIAREVGAAPAVARALTMAGYLQVLSGGRTRDWPPSRRWRPSTPTMTWSSGGATTGVRCHC